MSSQIFNTSGVFTLASAAATLTWLAGGSQWWGVAGIAIDETNKRIVRRVAPPSKLAASLEWAGEVALSTAILTKIKKTEYVLPAALVAQVAAHEIGKDLPVRTLSTLAVLYQQGFFKLPQK